MMKLLLPILIITFWANSCLVNAQQTVPSDRWKEYLEEMFPDPEDEYLIENLYYDLSYLADHPFDINTVKAEQLKRLPFLSDSQIGSIINYRKTHGNLLDVQQLRFVDNIDVKTVNLLLSFVHVAEGVERFPFNIRNVLKYGRSDLIIRYDQCLQEKKGYRSLSDSILAKYPNRQYLGEPFYHSLRYSYSYSDHLNVGFTAEKDAGEPFWNRHHKGYDFYSAHLFIKYAGWLKSFALGDYRASFGQGLVISSEFTPSKAATFTQMERRTNGFSKHSSTNENDFFRGTALTAQLGRMDISAFYSFRKLDANLTDDKVTSLKTDGLHRLVREKEKKGALDMQTFGGNIHYSFQDKDNLHYPYTYISIGLTAMHCSFLNHPIMPNPKPYNLFYFKGNNNTNISMDYTVENDFMKFYGETAIDSDKAIATINALKCTPMSDINFLILHRYYDKRYNAFFSNAFSQSSTIRNENGVYLGLKLTLSYDWRLSTYTDRFYSSWLNYGIDAPSSGTEYMAQLDFIGLEEHDALFYFRYKYKQKEKNTTSPNKATADILPCSQHNMRLQTQYKIKNIELKTSADGVSYLTEKRENGILIAQDARWSPVRNVQLSLYAGWFQTGSYSTRLISREKNIYYAYNYTQLYGKGLRLSAIARWDLPQRLSLSIKAGNTGYTDRDVTGTDLEEIEGRQKTDLTILLRWKI